MALAPIRALAPDARLRRIHYDWLEAGEVTQRTVARLSEQLRRYLDDQAWLENRRIMELIRQVEQKALALRGQIPDAAFSEVDDAAPAIALPMERLLYTPPFKADLHAVQVEESTATIVTDALFEQVHVDAGRLASNVRRALQTRSQVSLATIVMDHPIEQGLAEVATYLKLATQEVAAVIDDERAETVSWNAGDGLQNSRASCSTSASPTGRRKKSAPSADSRNSSRSGASTPAPAMR